MTPEQKLEQAYQEGRKAFWDTLAGKDQANPYDKVSDFPYYNKWEDGYKKAEQEYKNSML